jgi:Ca2+-transporting ATPase
VVFELVILQAVKRKYRASILSNRPLIASVGASVALQLAVVYVPALQAVFGTVALGLADWLCLAAATGVMILLVELKNRYLG